MAKIPWKVSLDGAVAQCHRGHAKEHVAFSSCSDLIEVLRPSMQ